jgi:5-aminopentanamidase
MKLSIVQFAPEFGNIKSNVQYMTEKIYQSKSDIIVFPELCTSGYDFIDKAELELYAESFDGPTVALFAEMAREQNKIISFGFAEKAGNDIYNSAVVLFPDDKYNAVYRKIHLFFRERFYFTEGDKGFFNIFYPDWDLNIAPMICYDWRFPEAARSLSLLGADLILCPSNLVTPVWHKVTPARAIENKVYLAVANRVGTENRSGQELIFNGQSVIHSYNGDNLAIADKTSEVVVDAEIFPIETRKKSFNEYNDIFKDRRTQYYKL